MPATDHFFRNQNTMHAVFAVSCVVMLVATIGMMVKDQTDEWRVYQKQGFNLSAATKQRDIDALRTEGYLATAERLTSEASRVEEALSATELKALAENQIQALDTATRKVELLSETLKSKGALRDEKRGNYNLKVANNLPFENAMAEFHEAQGAVDAMRLEVEEAQKAQADVNDPAAEVNVDKKAELERLLALQATLKIITGKLDKLESEETLLEDAMLKEKPTSMVSRLKRWSMEQPILDGFNSHLKVHQDWLPDLMLQLGMTSIARFDRCRTCHINSDKTLPGNLQAYPHGNPESESIHDWVEANEFPHPFATHPNTDLFVTAASPHPVSKFGCTICHDGQGSGTSFGNGEHTPNDPHQQHEWEEEYGYHANHFWEYPMLPERLQESGCIKCHHDVVELGQHPEFGASAPKVDRGFKLIQKYGCFGCHEIHGSDGGVAIGPDMRLEPQTEAEALRIAEDPNKRPGLYRKVGPSLRSIAAKTGADFIANWTQDPSRFRPSTKMPKFFGNSNQQSELAKNYEAVELAGLAHLLTGLSEELDMLQPADGYQPDAERGKMYFAEKGCLSCHTHAAIPDAGDDMAPNISDIHRKVKRNADDADFSDWLYTWIREPTRYHKRTKMGELFYDVYTGDEAPTDIDPVADIVAFLLSQGPAETFETPEYKDEDLDSLTELFLRKGRFSKEAVEEVLETKTFPQKKQSIKGDEIALATEDGSAVADDATWKSMKLEYIGRKTVSRYGCYGCHDISGYENSRPIGAALQDWGRKDTSKLGLEHIRDFLHHHGEPAGSKFESTEARVEHAIEAAAGGGVATKSFASKEEEERELGAAYFYENLVHHGRPGFIWQKLRDPRSYDYLATETKGYDEYLRMPKFPLQEDEIEAIATFVLGLVADPPSEQYIYQPDERDRTRIEGEFLMAKYNCVGCHMLEMPEVTFGVDEYPSTDLTPADHPAALDLLLKLRHPKQGLTGEMRQFTIDEEEVTLPIAKVSGLQMAFPDPDEEDPAFRESIFDSFDVIDFGEGDDATRLLPSGKVIVTDDRMVSYKEGRGGRFAEWLVDHLVEEKTDGNRQLAWQASPPPLYQEGIKIQTPWLYDFLLEPQTIRHTTVLRMPKFNMSMEEARVLANYFAAVDGSDFPYHEQEATSQAYLDSQQLELTKEGVLAKDAGYLHEGWKSLNGTLCIKCHSVGGRKFKVSDPKNDVQGPDLNRVQRRLRSDWVKLWLYNPKWIVPYTSMPLNFPHNNGAQFPDLYNGDAGAQVEGTVDALLNYTRMMEEVGPTTYAPPVKKESPVIEGQTTVDPEADGQLQAATE
jgi:cbb3-type cytochrome oxidase cytochrome c subunit/cytochrome c551/c552